MVILRSSLNTQETNSNGSSPYGAQVFPAHGPLAVNNPLTPQGIKQLTAYNDSKHLVSPTYTNSIGESNGIARFSDGKLSSTTEYRVCSEDAAQHDASSESLVISTM